MHFVCCYLMFPVVLLDYLPFLYVKYLSKSSSHMSVLSPDLSLGSGVTGASRRVLHPDGGPAESHPGPDADHEAAQRQPRCLPEAQHAALQPRRTPRVAQVSFGG